jgi:twinkle protein
MTWEFNGSAFTVKKKGTHFTRKSMEARTEEAVFAARGLDLEIATRLGAKFSGGKFTFDYLKNGKLLYRKVRTQDKQFWIEPKGQPLQFWNLDVIRGFQSRPEEPLVICEGEMDCIAIVQSCGGYVISVPNGVSGKRTEKDITIAEDTRFSYLWEKERLISEVAQFDRIILATDGDEPGQILRDELALRIGDARCWYVTYPDGCKDANEVLFKHGVDAVNALISDARPIRPGHLMKPSDIPPRPRETVYSTGLEFLDPFIKPERPELIVFTGMPGHGKGQMIRVICFHMAETHGWRIAFLTPEDPAHRVKRDMRRFALRNNPYANRQQQQEAIDWIDNHFRISMPPDDEALTLERVEHEMEVAALHHGCQVFVLDPWNEVEHKLGKGETTDTYIERSLRQLKRKMRRLGLILIISAHPTKLQKGQVPELYSISGSANWRNKSEHGVIVYRNNDNDNVVNFIVEKSKDWETTGTPGELTLEFNRDKCDYDVVKTL